MTELEMLIKVLTEDIKKHGPRTLDTAILRRLISDSILLWGRQGEGPDIGDLHY